MCACVWNYMSNLFYNEFINVDKRNCQLRIKSPLYDILAIKHCHTKLIEECISLKLFVSLIFIQKPYQTPQISGTFITLDWHRVFTCVKLRIYERGTQSMIRERVSKVKYVFSSHALCYCHYYEKEKIWRYDFIFRLQLSSSAKNIYIIYYVSNNIYVYVYVCMCVHTFVDNENYERLWVQTP